MSVVPGSVTDLGEKPGNQRGASQPGRTALITGISGQDGTYLAKMLLTRGYSVVGTSRDSSLIRTHSMQALDLLGKVTLVSMASDDFRSVLQTLMRWQPDEIYHLAGQSSVGLSFEQPVEAISSIALGTLNLLEAIKFCKQSIRFYHAGSSECFGDTLGQPACETTPFKPRSPYAVAKVCAHNLVANYREAYGLFACSGVLFNHESPLRPERFVTQKIVQAACRISRGDKTPLTLGNLDIHRDWGWAEEYVEVMWRMLQQDTADDYVIATGRTVSLAYFVERAFAHFNLDWRDHVRSDPVLMRPSDIRFGAADPSRARAELGWSARISVEDVVNRMCEAAFNTQTGQRP